MVASQRSHPLRGRGADGNLQSRPNVVPRRRIEYILCAVVIAVVATAVRTDDDVPLLARPSLSSTAVQPAEASTSSKSGTALDQLRQTHLSRVRRQSFSMTQDLDALAVMLREASQRRRMKNALAFFNALRKRQLDSNTSPDDLSSNEIPEIPVKVDVVDRSVMNAAERSAPVVHAGVS